MDIEQALKGLEPLSGQVVPIRTVQETRPVEDYGTACPIGIGSQD